MPTSNAIAERAFSQLKLIKTDLRNNLSNETLVNILRVKYHLKESKETAATVTFSDDLISRCSKVKANKKIGDDETSSNN